MSQDNLIGRDINEHCGKIADVIIRNCLASGANDNLTCIFVCFENFKNLLFGNDNNNSFNNGMININMIMNNLRGITEQTFEELISLDGQNNNYTFNEEKIKRNVSSRKNTNGNLISTEKLSRSKSENKTINNSQISKENRKERKFHMTLSQHNNFEPNTTKLTSPGKPKVLSPINGKAINKYFSPTNTSLKNFNATLINSGLSNQLLNQQNGYGMNPLDEHMQTKNKFNKSTVVNNKLDLISPKHTEINRKLNIKSFHDDKFKSLPAININMSLKNKI